MIWCARFDEEPHFARRTIDGEEFVFIANMEQDTPIAGVLYACGRKEKLVLYPGDIRYASVRYDNIPAAPVLGDPVTELPATAPVTFRAPNTVSLEYFEYDGAAVTKHEDVPSLVFPFAAETPLDGLSVMIPAFCMQKITAVMLDGEPLSAGCTQVFDDDYCAFALPQVQRGEHTLEIVKDAPLTAECLLFLSGEFDAAVEGEHVFHKTTRGIYNLHMCIPDRARTVLSVRRSVLDTSRPWAAQGQPFYSGGVTYHMTVSVPHDGRYQLSLGEVRDTVALSVNGGDVQKCIMQPYVFEADLCSGENRLDITVYNSYANLLEGYAEAGGLLSGGKIRPVLSCGT